MKEPKGPVKIAAEIFIAFALAFSVATLIFTQADHVSAQEQIAKEWKVTIVGNPPCQEFVTYASSIPMYLYNDVSWDGRIEFINTSPDNRIAYSDGQLHLNLVGPLGKGTGYNEVTIYNVHIGALLPCNEAIVSLKKETYADAAFQHWYLNNQWYVDSDDPERQTLVDGMGYCFLADELPFYDYLIKWDGNSQPTCPQLKVVQYLHTIGSVMGSGVQNLIYRYCSS